ncbi:MAG: hypothetical protein QXT59_08155 [Zestosphaera sp.]
MVRDVIVKINYFVLVFIVLISISVVSLVFSGFFNRVSLSVGPFVVRAAGFGERGALTIIFEDNDFVLDGKKLSGEVIVSFGGETHVITTTELSRTKRITLYFSEGLRRESERLMKTYLKTGVVEGMSGGEIIKRLREHGISGFTLPTLSITIWLNDEEGHDYICSDAFTSIEYFMSLGNDYFESSKKAFEDPLAIIEKGVTITIPKVERLREFLIETDITPVIRGIHRELGFGEDTLKPTITSQSSDVYQGGYYWNLPENPPQFFRNRLVVKGGDETWLENYAWQNFRDYYARVWIFKKSRFPTIASVKEYLNSAVMGWCYRPKYFVNFEAILTNCLNPSPSYSIAWNHTLQPGTEFTFYKPLVITVTSSYQNIPPLVTGIVYGVAAAGLRKHGPTIMGVLIGSGITQFLSEDTKFIAFTSYDWQLGRSHAALVIPAFMWYYYDAFTLKWDVWSLNNEEWVAVPVPIITPYYVENTMVSSNYWSRDYYDSSGNRVAGDYSYVSNIYTQLSNVTGALRVDEDIVKDLLHSNIPDYWETIDSSSVSGTYYAEENLASIMFGILGTLVGKLGIKEAPVLGALISLVGYADTTFYGSAVALELSWKRDGPPQQVPISVKKITSQYVNATYSALGKRPLIAQYVVAIGPEPCPPNMPCEIPEGNKTS